MKRVIVLLVVLACAMPAMAFHSRAGRSYDCASCHIPHHAGNLTDMPLWNTDTDVQNNYSGAWLKYNSETLDAENLGAPQGPTRVCLGCHDASGGTHAINGDAGDLRGTHPIEFVYDKALADADGELVDPTTALSGISELGTITDDLLSPSGQLLNCQSCHDIHIQGLSDVSYDWSGQESLESRGKGGLAAGEVADLVNGMIFVDADGDEAYNADVDVEKVESSGKHSWKIPYLVPISGIDYAPGYSANRYGRTSKKSEWELDYGALCLTCHIK